MVKIILFGGIIGLGAFVVAGLAGLISGNGWFLAVLLGIIWFFALTVSAMAAGRSDYYKSLESCHLITETVIVISKLHEMDVSGMSGVTSTTNSYALVFEFPDRRREKLEVTAEQYAFVREGETGILRYRNIEDVHMYGNAAGNGILFVDFQPE